MGSGADDDHLLARTLAWLARLVAVPTVTFTPNLPLIDTVEAAMTGLGARVRRTTSADGQRANLLVTLGPAVDGGLVLAGHTDVVPAPVEGWVGDPFVLRREPDPSDPAGGMRSVGRGTADMKGFLACALALAEQGRDLVRPLHLALTFDEEVGCLGAPLLLDDLQAAGIRPARAVVGEPTMLDVGIAHKGCDEYTTTITGVEGHGSAPDAGVNAVAAGADYVRRLQALAATLAAEADPTSPFDPPGTTVNVGVIEGGSAHNVIAGRCRVAFECRPVSVAAAHRVRTALDAIDAEVRAVLSARDPATSLERETIGAVGGLEPRDGSALVARLLELRPAAVTQVLAYNTEAGLFQAAGMDTVVCGPGSIEVAHQPEEHVTDAQLRGCLALLGGLIADLETPADRS
ncbi:MAG: acetylornithine deacetylase [Nitriliruptoraceae bacterium]|nr:acetylornithine deacetylase [Nitriliruptoraceae bacterium]